jgi:hypothetical protein
MKNKTFEIFRMGLLDPRIPDPLQVIELVFETTISCVRIALLQFEVIWQLTSSKGMSKESVRPKSLRNQKWRYAGQGRTLCPRDSQRHLLMLFPVLNGACWFRAGLLQLEFRFCSKSEYVGRQ